MKRKNGFTLLELLAVILVIALIALIVVPIILNVIEQSKKNAALRSAENYIKAVEDNYTYNELKNQTKIIGDNINVSNITVNMKGSLPTSGILNIATNGVVIKASNLCINNYNINYSNNKYTITGDCNSQLVNGFQKVTDSNAGIICGDGQEEDYDNNTICKIESIEDLVEFSKLVASGKNFNSKTVVLKQSLDFKNDNSYSNPKAKMGDINGDGQEDSIKTELTTSTGFKPIGISGKAFSGTFEGSANIIKSLYINRPSENYVGFIGNTSGGKIKGITLENIDINGKGYVGGLVGSANSTISEIKVSGTVKGKDYVGGIIGTGMGTNSRKGLIANVDVSGTSYIGGIIGSQSAGSTYGIIESGNITSTGTGTAGARTAKIAGYRNGGNVVGYAYEGVTVTYKGGSTIDSSAVNGTSFDSSKLNDINYYDYTCDTVLAGDNDSSGYYFDYNDASKLVIKSIEKESLDYVPEGEGTSEKPYLIKTKEDMKYIAIHPTDSKYYKLVNDIDYTNNKYYMIGTSSNAFQGKFDGNMKKLSNVIVNGYEKTGIFGNTSSATIEGLNIKNMRVNCDSTYCGFIGNASGGKIKGITLENIDITGVVSVGGLVGSANSTISEIKVSGTVKGKDYVGGIIGTGMGTNSRKGLIANVDVSGTSYIGGIIGSQSAGSTYGIIESGNITSTGTGTAGARTAKIAGYRNGGNVVGYAYEGVTVTYKGGSTIDSSAVNGTSFDSSKLNDINYYGNAINISNASSTGYYFDYNSSGTSIIIKKVG